MIDLQKYKKMYVLEMVSFNSEVDNRQSYVVMCQLYILLGKINSQDPNKRGWGGIFCHFFFLDFFFVFVIS